jgi:transposase-like protein
MRQLRRRTHVVRILPNAAFCTRVASLLHALAQKQGGNNDN